MKNLIKIIATTILASALIYSCKKKDEPTPALPAANMKTSNLTNKNWGMSACTFEPPISGNYQGFPYSVSNLYDPLYDPVTACAKDDTLKFTAKSNSELLGEYATKVNTKCGSESDEIGTWKFNVDQTQIILTDQGNTKSQTFTLLEVTEKRMKVRTIMKNPVDASDPKDYTATITFNSK